MCVLVRVNIYFYIRIYKHEKTLKVGAERMDICVTMYENRDQSPVSRVIQISYNIQLKFELPKVTKSYQSSFTYLMKIGSLRVVTIL